MNCINCLECTNHYIKDINYDETNPDEVIICSIDDFYIGYFDEAEKEHCRFTKEEIEEYEKKFYRK